MKITAMKKIILSGIVILVLTLTIGINLNFTKASSGIALKNIEALARGEGGGGGTSKPKGTYSCTYRKGFTAYKIYDVGCKCSKYTDFESGATTCTCSNY